MKPYQSGLDTDQHIHLIALIRNNTIHDLDRLVKDIIKDYLQKEKSFIHIHDFFTFIYDNIYYDILFKKIHLKKQTVRILETLAMPNYSTSTINAILKKL